LVRRIVTVYAIAGATMFDPSANLEVMAGSLVRAKVEALSGKFAD